MSIFRPPLRQGQWITLLAAWLTSMPVAECVFRLARQRPSEDLGGLFVPFGHGSYKLGPWVNTQTPWAPGRFSVHTDGLGLCCDADRRLTTKAGDHLDLLSLGDSQGFGHGVSFRDSIAGSAAELAPTDGMRCANACVNGPRCGINSNSCNGLWVRIASRSAITWSCSRLRSFRTSTTPPCPPLARTVGYMEIRPTLLTVCGNGQKLTACSTTASGMR